MKQPLFTILVILTLNLFGQNLNEKVGEIEVQLIEHRFKRNSDYELTKRKTNKSNRPNSKLHFDSKGILLKKVTFGKHHNSDLKLTDKIKIYNHENGKLSESIEYESDYQKNVYPYYRTKYIYNQKGQLIDESTFYYKTDSLFFQTTFEYDLNSNNNKSIFDPTYYYQKEFDSINRITSLKQIYDNKLRWEWNYSYSKNKRIGIFQTHYNDGKDYSKEEIQNYNGKNLLIETEEKHVSKNGLDQKIKIFYFENGVIKRIENFESYSILKGYELVSYSEIKIKCKMKINSGIAERINEQININ